jgi:hypothetical protein
VGWRMQAHRNGCVPRSLLKQAAHTYRDNP